MAFNIQNFARITAAGQSVAPALNTYGTSDSFATASASGYFNENALNLNVGDIIFIKASDSNLAVQVTATTPNVTVQTLGNYQNALPDGAFLIGNGSNVAAPHVITGDITFTNTGLGTIGKVVDGDNAANIPDNSQVGGLLVIHSIAVTGGATANYDVELINKSRVIDSWVQYNGAGAAGDTIQVLNTAAAITNAMDGNQLDTAIVRAGNINDANATINAGGTLRVTQTDAAGSNAPPCTVYVAVMHVA